MFNFQVEVVSAVLMLPMCVLHGELTQKGFQDCVPFWCLPLEQVGGGGKQASEPSFPDRCC